MPKNEPVPNADIDLLAEKNKKIRDSLEKEVNDKKLAALAPDRILNAVWKGYELNAMSLPESNFHEYAIQQLHAIGEKKKVKILQGLKAIDPKLYDIGLNCGSNMDNVLFFAHLKYKDSQAFKITEQEVNAAISAYPDCDSNKELSETLAGAMLGYLEINPTIQPGIGSYPMPDLIKSAYLQKASKGDTIAQEIVKIVGGTERELNRMLMSPMQMPQVHP